MIVIGTTLTTYAMLDPDRSYMWDAWLRHAELIIETAPDEVRYFVAIETDARGIEPFQALLDRLEKIGGEYWRFDLDDGRRDVHTFNRLRHITMGQNLLSDYAHAMGATHLLHMAADCEPTPAVLPKLLAVNAPLAAAYCPTYGLRGEELTAEYPDFPVTGPSPVGSPFAAVCVLIQREVFKRLKWRYDIDLGMSDDPALCFDLKEFYNEEVRIRLDCIATHHPTCISSVETRYPGLDMSVQR